MMESKYVNYNGRIYSNADAVFPLNRAMNYGDGLFESIRLHEGEVLFLEDHFNRMLLGMKALQMQVPEHFSIFFFHKQLMELTALEQAGGNARLRIGVFRSGYGLYEPETAQAVYFLQVMPLAHGYRWSDVGCELGVYHGVPGNFSEISFFKTMNALPYVLAALHKREYHLDDCLLINSSGHVTDAISSNVFWIKEQVFFSTPLSAGSIHGIMRSKLIDVITANGFSFRESSIDPEQLLLADEIFLTNTGWGIKAVTCYKGKNFPTSQTKQLFNLLLRFING